LQDTKEHEEKGKDISCIYSSAERGSGSECC